MPPFLVIIIHETGTRAATGFVGSEGSQGGNNVPGLGQGEGGGHCRELIYGSLKDTQDPGEGRRPGWGGDLSGRSQVTAAKEPRQRIRNSWPRSRWDGKARCQLAPRRCPAKGRAEPHTWDEGGVGQGTSRPPSSHPGVDNTELQLPTSGPTGPRGNMAKSSDSTV